MPDKRYLNLLYLIEQTILFNEKDSLKTSVNEDSKHCLIKRATVTPSRVIFYFPEKYFTNRVIRHFDQKSFLRVKFEDDDFKKLNKAVNCCDMSFVYTRISNILKAGINLQINSSSNLKFEFLAMSSSQLREHGCWMYCNTKDSNAGQIRDWMGDFSGIKCIGKYAARLGQSLSSSIETFTVDEKMFCLIKDIETFDRKYCFSDGIGKISEEKAHEICQQHYPDQKNISAFQIR